MSSLSPTLSQTPPPQLPPPPLPGPVAAWGASPLSPCPPSRGTQPSPGPQLQSGQGLSREVCDELEPVNNLERFCVCGRNTKNTIASFSQLSLTSITAPGGLTKVTSCLPGLLQLLLAHLPGWRAHHHRFTRVNLSVVKRMQGDVVKAWVLGTDRQFGVQIPALLGSINWVSLDT